MPFEYRQILESEKAEIDLAAISGFVPGRPSLARWTIDRSRNCFLLYIGRYPDGLIHYSFFWNGKYAQVVMKIAVEVMRGQPASAGEKKGLVKIHRLATVDGEAMTTKRMRDASDEMLQALKEALTAEAFGGNPVVVGDVRFEAL